MVWNRFFRTGSDPFPNRFHYQKRTGTGSFEPVPNGSRTGSITKNGLEPVLSNRFRTRSRTGSITKNGLEPVLSGSSEPLPRTPFYTRPFRENEVTFTKKLRRTKIEIKRVCQLLA